MKSTLLRKLLCALALSLMPFLAFAGGTNTQSDPSTGYEKAPDKSTQQGDMGTGVGTEDSTAPQERVSDSELTKNVEKALKNEAQLKNLDIDVEVNDGVVTLSGDAKDVRFQGRAAKVASSVKGVKSVQNNLSINGKKK
jgi:hyperosmotically inducible periplasmic protein